MTDVGDILYRVSFGDVGLYATEHVDSVAVAVTVEGSIRAIRLWPSHIRELRDALTKWLVANECGDAPEPAPIPMRLPCPDCGELHVDLGEFATRPHHTHACQHCGMVWRPAVVATVGVSFLPGFKNEEGDGG